MESALFILIVLLLIILFCFLSFIFTIWMGVGIHDNIVINSEYYHVLDKPKVFYITIMSVNEVKTIFVGSLLFKSFYIS